LSYNLLSTAFRSSTKRSGTDADERRQDAISDSVRRHTAPDAGSSGAGRSRRRSESGTDLTDHVVHERRRIEAVLSQQQATRRWYSSLHHDKCFLTLLADSTTRSMIDSVIMSSVCPSVTLWLWRSVWVHIDS